MGFVTPKTVTFGKKYFVTKRLVWLEAYKSRLQRRKFEFEWNGIDFFENIIWDRSVNIPLSTLGMVARAQNIINKGLKKHLQLSILFWSQSYKEI